MDASNQRRVYFVDGKAIELWENPQFEFGWTEEDLNAAATNERWVTLFNMLVLRSSYQLGENAFE